MAFEFILPDIGEGVVEAEVQKWFVKPGDEVQEDQPLVEVMTDKATVTIPSPRRGRVTKLHYEEGQIAKVHFPLLQMEELEAVAGNVSRLPLPAADARAEAASAGVGGSVVEPRVAVASNAAPELHAGARPKVLATPAVRAMARQMGVDLQAVHGSGPGGRVTKDDLAHSRNGHAVALEAHDAPEPAQTPAGAQGDEIVPVRGIRRKIAERMAQSKRTAAHFTFVEQVDVTELVKVKERIAAAAAEEGVKVTYMPFIVKAAVAALRKHPWLNSTFDEARGEIRLRREFHIGVAAATEQGLVVPVIRNADRLSLLDLAREIDRLSSDCKAGKAKPQDVGGSTFTITSLGALGGLFATPIINYPESAILGIHRIRPTPVVRDGQIVARDVMHVSLSFDHRVIDGHVGAAFAYTLIGYLEDPNLLFMQMV
jgi:pyruvate dehydrogenase E2 component (dihydrolipoamide acetyltransferase)